MESGIHAEQVLEYLKKNVFRPQRYEEILEGLAFPDECRGELNRILGQLEKQGDIIRTRRDQYGLPEMMNICRGVIRLTSRGFGVVSAENEAVGEVFVLGRDLNGAMHEDKVMVRLTHSGYGDRRPEGEIVRILQRANTKLVGTFQHLHRAGQVIPDDPRQIYPVIIRNSGKVRVRQGDKVFVEITAWPGKNSDPEGRIVEVFGKSGQPGSDLKMVIRKHELREEFPGSVMEEAHRAFAAGIGEIEAGRRDLTGEMLITIDGDDSKDLDDAVSLTALPNGWRLGVHIADVSHYVQPESELDREAYERGTSVYLLHDVLPMLPPELCNGICSLNPGEDRLAISCVMELDTAGTVQKYEIFHSLICTRERMTYANVNRLLAGADPDLEARYKEILPMLREMKRAADVLRENRTRRGALDFDFPEAVIRTDREGNPVDIAVRERGDGEKLIEDFMIQANEVVAAHLFRLKAPILYRVHEKPGQEGLEKLESLLKVFGCPLPRPVQSPKAWQQVLEAIRGEPFAETVALLLLRSLKHADYRPEELGHFGLASEYYCHFTSPIRRYPDLIVHRTLSYSLRQELDETKRHRLEVNMKEWSEHCSLQERRAEEAERDLTDCKKARYMEDFVGDCFQAHIVSVQNFGFFVQLPNTVEGLVHISSLEDDYYHYDERTLTLSGSHTGQHFRIGDEVEVMLVKVDAASARIDFELCREARKKTDLKKQLPQQHPDEKGKTREEIRDKGRENDHEQERKQERSKNGRRGHGAGNRRRNRRTGNRKRSH